jgi:hypothetical protein
MSVDTREVYFTLARALTLASLAKGLSVPMSPTDAEYLSKEQLDLFQKEFEKNFELNDIEHWSFGGPASENQPPFHRLRSMSFFSDSVAVFGLA